MFSREAAFGFPPQAKGWLACLTIMRTLSILVILASLALPAVAEPVASSAGQGSMSGTVVKEPGSEPLKKVLVQVIAEDQKQGGNYSASTDADGHFAVENMVPGRYRVFFERTGFVAVNAQGLKADTNVFTVRAGQAVADLYFRMLPTAVISGRVTDEDGDPMPEVRVVVQKKRAGKAGRESVGMAATNDLGEYRLAGLFPGQYWVVAIPAPDFRDYERQQDKSARLDQQTESAPETRYLPTYYPGTNDALQGSSVALRPGDEVPVNLTLLPARAFQVRGVVSGIRANQSMVVELVAKADDSVRSVEVRPDGQFEIRGVGPGTYVLRASSGTDAQSLTARQDVTVGAADVDGIKLVPQPSFNINGHLRVEGNGGDITQYSINLRQAEAGAEGGLFASQESFGANAPVNRAGNFEWKNVNPGNYIVQVYGGNERGFFLKSATMAGRDISNGFLASGPASVELVVSTKGGTIEGTVLAKGTGGDKDVPEANASVVMVPDEKYRKVPDRYLNGATDQQGHFLIRGIPPGTYTVFAWQGLEEGVWSDPEFLKAQEGNGRTMRVEEDSHQSVELQLSSAGEEWH